MHEITPLCCEVSPLSPSTEVAYFIEKGHIMEYIDLGPRTSRIVALFFGPSEFVVKCHPLSTLVTLDNVKGNPFTHGQVLNILRKFPETRHHYQGIRQTYNEKVAARQLSLTIMSEKARFEDMVKRQPWILKLAKSNDIAAYLNISTSLLSAFINNSKQNN